MKRRCNQCRELKPVKAFGTALKNCIDCRARAVGGYNRRGRDPRLDVRTELRVTWRPRSLVAKLGGIPSSSTAGFTCPTSCSLRGNGCYAEYGYGGSRWRRMSMGEEGIGWPDFLDKIRGLPPGQLWRHNLAGDLPGKGNRVSPKRIAELVAANRGRRGFTFTHKPVLRSTPARIVVAGANRFGLTVNLSAVGPKKADKLAVLGIGPVVTVLKHDAPVRSLTPKGRTILVCPAQRTDDGATCASCGWCADARRDWVVGFRAHGQMAHRVSLRVK